LYENEGTASVLVWQRLTVVEHWQNVVQRAVKAYQPELKDGQTVTQSAKNIQLVQLRKRSDFLRVASTRSKHVTPGLILQYRRHTLKEIQSSQSVTLQLGFTVSKKVGNSVTRNRVKRRLRAVARAILPTKESLHHDFVIIGRQNTIKRPFPDLLCDLEMALKKLQSNMSVK
jgi:ribonuclease P protein component